MRIGIDTAPIIQHRNRGVGALGAHLLQALLDTGTRHRFLLFAQDDGGDSSGGFHKCPGAEIVSRPAAGTPFSLSWIRDALRLRRQVAQERPDIFHAYFQWNLPILRMRMPVVGHIYDLLPMALRDIYLHRRNIRVSAKIGLYRKYLKFALKNVDWVITISEHSRVDLIQTMGFPEERTRVVYPAPASGMRVPERENEIHSLREKWGLEGGYLLYLGGYDYRKNLEMLLAAYRRARNSGLLFPLVLTGGMGSPYGQMIQALVKDAGEGAGIRLIGHISDEELPALYAGARLFLYPSLYEGFGLPVLDAMACGTPVISSNAASLPEAGGEAALMLDPKDEISWADAMFRMSDDGELHDEYRRRGINHAAGFSWERSASEVIKVYEEMV